MVHCANFFRLDFTTNFWMILLGSKSLKTSKFAAIRHKATRRSCDIVDLSSLFTLFSMEKLLSSEATAHGKVSNNLRAVSAFGKVAATSPWTICSIRYSNRLLCFMGLSPLQFLSFFVAFGFIINELPPLIQELFERLFNKLSILPNFHFHLIIKMIWISIF